MFAGINSRYVGLVVVLALAVLSWWLQREEQAQGADVPDEGRVADYAIRDFEMTTMDAQGRPRSRLEAVSMAHFSDDDSAELQRPELLVYRQNGEPWNLSSESAVISQGGTVIHLRGVVQMRRLDDAGQVTLQVDTRELWFYSDQEYAESSEQVVISDAMGVTRAKGMTIDLKAGRLQLLAGVQSEYVLE